MLPLTTMGRLRCTFVHFVLASSVIAAENLIWSSRMGYHKTNGVELLNNGYEGIVVAIEERIPENPQLLEKIKDTFNNASRHLFLATLHRAYFRNITILVPRSWNMQEYKSATWQTLDKATVRIGLGKSRPFVRQLSECGKGGQFMYIPNNIFLQNSTWTPGKTIVHEWGHLRWGLFDEYALNYSETFYRSSRGVEITRCPLRIIAQAKGANSTKACGSTQSLNSLLNNNCTYRVNFDASKLLNVKASYMFGELSLETGFCDNDTSNESPLHNKEATNMQNRQCRHRSAWEVMRDHEDFSDGRNPSIQVNIGSFNTNATFNIVRRNAAAYVVVMDTSGSMLDNNNHVSLANSVKQFILTIIPDGSLVGLVSFSTTAKKITDSLKLVNSIEDREELVALVQPAAEGMTSIGSGMEAALQLLAQKKDTSGSFIFLMTDGNENTSPWVAHVLPDIQDAGVILDSLLFTRSADTSLISAAATTGGRSFFDSGAETGAGLFDAFTSMVTYREGGSPNVAIMLCSHAVIVKPFGTSCTPVVVDEEIGKDLAFSLAWQRQGFSFRLFISSPSKLQNYSQVPGARDSTLVVVIPGLAEVGRWNVCLESNVSDEMKIQVNAQSKAINVSSSPITVALTFSKNVADLSGSEDPLSIYATVTKDYLPVANAKVIATIEDAKGIATDIELRDNGSGADIIKDDGTYSRFLSYLQSNGMYSTKVRVEGSSGAEVLLRSSGSASSSDEAGYEYYGDTSARSLMRIPVSPFERVATGVLIQVTGIQQNNGEQVMPLKGGMSRVDKMPPSRIQDLGVKETSSEQRTISITFTAVGDDYDEGNASRYHILYSFDDTRDFRNFEDGIPINDTDLVNGTLSSPLASGSSEVFTFHADAGRLLKVAVTAEDEAGNVGPLSNVVQTIIVNEDATLQSTEVAPAVTVPVGSYDSEPQWLLVLGTSVTVTMVSLILLLALFFRMKRRSGKATLATEYQCKSESAQEETECVYLRRQELP